MNFDGKPSIELKKRPLFSIVVACYNSRRTLGRLLASIESQDMNDEIEVILSDDCSTESYDDVVDDFKDRLCIKRVQTDYNCCPGNTREKGISVVEGEWLMICDHDDMLMEDALLDVKEYINTTHPQYYFYTNFHEAYDIPGNFEDHLIRDVTTQTGWNHGKFYNMDNLWRKFEVHFIKDMKTHEDIYISSLMNTIMHRVKHTPPHFNKFTYIWFKRPDSVSNIAYLHNGEKHFFLEVHFLDYLRSTSGVYKEQYLLGNVDMSLIKEHLSEMIMYEYFYVQSFIFHEREKVILDNIELCRRELIEFKQLTGLKNKDLWDIAADNHAAVWTAVQESASMACGRYIPKYSFEDWLDFLHKDVEGQVFPAPKR